MTFLERQNSEHSKKITGFQELRDWGRDEQMEHRGFGGSENTLYDTIIMYTCHYTFVQPQSVYNTKSESYIA